MTDHFVIFGNDLRLELSNAKPCQDCRGELGVLVDLTDDVPGEERWQVIQLHDVPCVAMSDPNRRKA